jgi:hypothetical protein
MQTLIDPFELAFRGPRTPVAPPTSIPDVDVQFDADSDDEVGEPPPSSRIPRSPDSSGRLRCWCSEED